jgi:peptide deformylase
MILPILRHGAAVLHVPAAPVSEFAPELQRLIDDMIQTMYAAPGIGLAAPQVGAGLRVFVADLSVGRQPADLYTFVNPEFVERDGMQLEEEGCLSAPGFNATVARPNHVVLRGLDRTGREQQVEATGLLARCFQHEMDHLDGRLFIDRLRGLQ